MELYTKLKNKSTSMPGLQDKPMGLSFSIFNFWDEVDVQSGLTMFILEYYAIWLLIYPFYIQPQKSCPRYTKNTEDKVP